METWAEKEPAASTDMLGRAVQRQEGVACSGLLGSSLVCVAPEGLAAQLCIPFAAKWYLTARLAGFHKVPAQQKGSGMWSHSCQEASRKGGYRVAVPGWREFATRGAWESLQSGSAAAGACRGGPCAKLPCSICPTVSCTRRALPECVLG